MHATSSPFFIVYLAVGGPSAICRVLVADINIGGHTAAWVIVALETEGHRFHHIEHDGCIH